MPTGSRSVRRRGLSRPRDPRGHPTTRFAVSDTAHLRRESSPRRHRARLRDRDQELALALGSTGSSGPDRLGPLRPRNHPQRPPERRSAQVQSGRTPGDLARAGNRCEYHLSIFGRCRTTSRLEADHVHPHSRGGRASVSNGQALCQRHNREKSARVPWNRQLNSLAKRRATYFLPNHDPVVVRHRPPNVRACPSSGWQSTPSESSPLNDAATPILGGTAEARRSLITSSCAGRVSNIPWRYMRRAFSVHLRQTGLRIRSGCTSRSTRPRRHHRSPVGSVAAWRPARRLTREQE